MEIVIRASVVFAVLVVLTRGMKRRTLGDLAPFELLLLVVLGDIVQQGITQEDYSLTGAILAVSTFAFGVTVISYASWRWKPVGRVIDGVPIVVVQDGEPIEEAPRSLRMRLSGPRSGARTSHRTTTANTNRTRMAQCRARAPVHRVTRRHTYRAVLDDESPQRRSRGGDQGFPSEHPQTRFEPVPPP